MIAISVERRTFATRTAGEFLWCVLGLPFSILWFVTTITLLSVGLGLLVLYVGVPLLVLGLLIARVGAWADLLLAGALLDLPVGPAAPIVLRRPGLTGRLLSVLADPGCWRAVLYHVFSILWAPVRFGVAIGVWAAGLGALVYPLWHVWLPVQFGDDGAPHRGAQIAPGVFIDSWPGMGLLFLVGLLLTLAAPFVVRVVTDVDRRLLLAFASR